MFFTLSYSNFIFAQYNQGGFIVPNDSIKKDYPYENSIFLPKEGITYYDAPNGSFLGKIRMGKPLLSQHENKTDSLLSSTISGTVLRPTLLDFENYFETFDDCFYLKFSEQKEGFIKIVNGNYGKTPKSAAWVSVDSLEKHNFKLNYWLDFYGSEGMIIHPKEKTHVIHENPYLDAPIIETINEDEYVVQIISFDEGTTTEGLFAKVKVIKYKIHPCYGGDTSKKNIIKEFEGWIQIIDQKGKSLVAHNSGGC
ncbi:hypothetical protein ACE193_00605 [Bernardetia sp. OM2101]|uniref:hypothetical protein n=1 Tax=Bernardetia sp. OM2101 TaxID=3344876 RepID=UPI0035CFFEFB